MKIRVEFMLTHESDVYDVGRVPCIGEDVSLDDECHEVRHVIHILDADPTNQVLAIVRVK